MQLNVVLLSCYSNPSHVDLSIRSAERNYRVASSTPIPTGKHEIIQALKEAVDARRTLVI